MKNRTRMIMNISDNFKKQRQINNTQKQNCRILYQELLSFYPDVDFFGSLVKYMSLRSAYG
uniref:Uncharacterized protein n=1 Tax=Arion vulgaris TaxID=1028688 RepID=A0A0B7BZR6_9EUPU